MSAQPSSPALQRPAVAEPTQPAVAGCSRAQEENTMKVSLTQVIFRTRLASSAPDTVRAATMLANRKAA